MVKLLYVMSGCAILTACAVLAFCAAGSSTDDAQLEEIHDRPDAVQLVRAHDSQPAARTAHVSPLIVQAQAFAQHLNLPKEPEEVPNSILTANPTSRVSSIRPAAPSLRFQLHGTSYYPIPS